MTAETTLRLARDFENIVAIKEASGNISQIAQIAQLCGDELDLYSGNDDQIVPLLSLGAKGVISVLSNIGGVVFSSMCGYWITRHQNKGTKFVFFILIAFMSIPFQALMIPFAKITSKMHLTNSLVGLSICFWAMTVPISTFITAGAVKSVPVEIEESALIDGCSHFKMYWVIVFPLIKASIFTFATINTLWFWNDYLMTQLMLSKKNLRTIQIAMQALFNEAFFAWDVALAALTLAILPLFIFFVIAQKQVLEGASAGAVKG